MKYSNMYSISEQRLAEVMAEDWLKYPENDKKMPKNMILSY